MRIKTCSFLASLTLGLACSSGVVADPSLEWASGQVAQIRALPDVALSYTFEIRGEKRPFEFISQGNCFFSKELDATSREVRNMVAYDGQTYYALYNGGHLVIMTRPSGTSAKFIAGHLICNPLYNRFAFFFVQDSSTFLLPDIGLMSSWQKVWPAHKWVGKQDGGKLRFFLHGDKYPSDFSFSPSGMVETVVSEDPEYHVVWATTEKSYPGIPGKMPASITCDYTINGSRSGDSYRLTVESLRLHGQPKLPETAFRIPRSAAQTVFDLDLGVSIKNPEAR